MRGATRSPSRSALTIRFQSTLLMRGATEIIPQQVPQDIISIHAPHARSDCRLRPPSGIALRHFNPRSSCEERLHSCRSSLSHCAFQSTLLMRGATTILENQHLKHGIFQSTLLMRGATRQLLAFLRPTNNFNPRSSCEERRGCLPARGSDRVFQSTLLMRGATILLRFFIVSSSRFQSTLLMRGATVNTGSMLIRKQLISIHAPHARSDAIIPVVLLAGDISIHAPHARSDVRAS